MAWTISLENEDRSVFGTLTNEFSTTINDLKKYKLLCYLDAYGDTIFNHLQMNDLIQDLQELEREEENPLLNEIRLLAEKCKIEPHTYLVFYGD